MAINRKFFFDHVRIHLFDGTLRQSQVAGMAAILDKWEREMPNADDRWLAYMLATAHHETGRAMQPVRETFAKSDSRAIAILNKAFNAGQLKWVKTPYWDYDADGKCWLGRGLVQLTHKYNYEEMGRQLEVDLVGDPQLAMDLGVAVNIMFSGMRNGAFTGRSLSDFFSRAKDDWRGARRIINGLERAELVASYGKYYYAGISYTVGP